MNRQRDPDGNPASCGRIHTYLFHARSGSEYKTKFCSKTCKSPHPKCNCGLVWRGFTISSGHRRKIICKGIKKSSWASVCKNISCNFADDTVFQQANVHPNSCLLRGISVPSQHTHTSFLSKNYPLFYDPFRYGSSCTFYGCV